MPYFGLWIHKRILEAYVTQFQARFPLLVGLGARGGLSGVEGGEAEVCVNTSISPPRPWRRPGLHNFSTPRAELTPPAMCKSASPARCGSKL